MALPFPNVPNLPGVPAVPRLPGAVTSTGLTIASGIKTLLANSAQRPNLWGVYAVGSQKPALVPDSTLEFSYRRDFNISDFPVVAGSFAAYNKVQRPFEVQLRLSKGGTQQERTQFLNSIEALSNSITLYNIHTPEKIYRDCNLSRWEVSRREARNAFFLTDVDLHFTQIRQTTAQYGDTGTFLLGVTPYSPAAEGDFNFSLLNAQSPAALPTTNQGNVQPLPATGQTASIGRSALGTAAANSKTF